MIHLVHAFCVFFALSSLARAAPVPLDFHRLIPRLAGPTPVVLDDREMLTYQAVSAPHAARSAALFNWFSHLRENRRLAELLGQHESTFDLVRTTPREVALFAAETRLLLVMLSQNQPRVLLDKQFLFWNFALRTVSFRWLSAADREHWKSVLDEVFASAFSSTDLTAESLARIENYFAAQPALIDATKTLLRDMDAPLDAQLYNARFRRRMAVTAFEMASLIGIYACVLPNLSVALVPGSPLQRLVFTLSGICGLGWLYQYGAARVTTVLGSVPASYSWSGRKITTLELSNLDRCRNLLESAE